MGSCWILGCAYGDGVMGPGGRGPGVFQVVSMVLSHVTGQFFTKERFLDKKLNFAIFGDSIFPRMAFGRAPIADYGLN